MAKSTKTTALDQLSIILDDTLPVHARVLRHIENLALITAPKGTNNDPLLHIGFMLRTAETAVKAQRDAWKEGIDAAFGEEIENTIPGTTAQVVSGKHYALTCQKRNAARSVDTKALRAELIKRGVKLDIIDDAYEAATKEAKPAVVLTVNPVSS